MELTWEKSQILQPLASKVLLNSIRKERLAHAYLLEGENGTGKKDVAFLLAKSLFCFRIDDDANPCNECINCKRINNQSHPDVHFIAPEGLSIKKDQIKALQQEFGKSGVESRKKLYIIEHVDKMTVNAANSLLKFLEEPQIETTAILLTEHIQQILPTIQSRCQIIPFVLVQPEILAEKLVSEGVPANKAPLYSEITNNLQEGILLNNDEWFAQAQNLVLKLYEANQKNAIQAMVFLQEEWYAHFKEKHELDRSLDLLLYIYKDLLYAKIGKDKFIYPQHQEKWERDALQVSVHTISARMDSILKAKRQLQSNMNPQLLMEQLMLRLQEGSNVV